jgi:hypothetical protein
MSLFNTHVRPMCLLYAPPVVCFAIRNPQYSAQLKEQRTSGISA